MNAASPSNSADTHLDSAQGELMDAQIPPSERWLIDQSCRQVVLLWYGSAVFWLLFGSLLALVASIKMHTPWFLADTAWLTFGRVIWTRRDFNALVAALTMSRRLASAIRTNLVFAVTYNTIGMSLAAVGLLHPIAAALLMLASSLTVTLRASRG